MNVREIAKSIRAGQSVAAIAEQLGITQHAVYQRMQKAGKSVRSIRAKAPHKSIVWRRVKRLGPGYRVGSNGAIQSCISPGTGQRTELWRDLAPSRLGDRHFIVYIGCGERRTRPSVRLILRDAFGQKHGQQIFDRVYLR